MSILQVLQSSARKSPEETDVIFEAGPAWSMGLDQRPPEVFPHLNESVISGTAWGKTHIYGSQVSISGRSKSLLPNSALSSQNHRAESKK